MVNTNGNNFKTCGKNIAGQRFGKLIAVEQAGSHPTRYGLLWLCRCDCGKTKVIQGRLLRDGTTRSCGCLVGKDIKHGDSHGITYASWRAMLKRCFNQKHQAYKNYGGRGITVCQRWREDYRAFLADMGQRPSKAFDLDRIDNNGNYEPGNCRWVTRRDNVNNRRATRLITFNGETLPLTEWADRVGMKRHTLQERIKAGVSAEFALFAPMQKGRKLPVPE